jgi:hypothetical protein
MRIASKIVFVVAGSLALVGCAGSEPSGSASSAAPAASSSSSEPAPNVPLRWESVLELGDDSYVRSLAATPAGTFVVANAVRADQCDPSPMWSDAANPVLTPMDVDGLLGEKASVMEVVAGGPGVVAVGCLPDPDRLVVWTSVDGTDWASSETGYLLPAGEARFWLGSVAAGPDRAVVVGGEFTDIGVYVQEIEEAAKETMPASLLPFAETNILVEPQRASMYVGPFSAWSATLADLGVDPQVGADYEAAISGGAASPVTFTTDDYRTWTVSREPPIPDAQNSSIVATSEGFMATSWDTMGPAPAVFASLDGITWSTVVAPVETGSVDQPTATGRRVVLGSQSPEGGRGLWLTEDLGGTWSELSPAPEGFWGTPAVGPLGYLSATAVDGPQTKPIEFTLESGDLTLTISMGTAGGSLRVADGERTIVDDPVDGDWRMATAPPSVAFDNAAGEMSIADPTTGKSLMSVPYSAVEAAFDEAVIEAGIGAATAAFSPDGRTWSQGPLPVPPGRYAGAGPTSVGTDAAWAVVSRAYGVSEVMRGTVP